MFFDKLDDEAAINFQCKCCGECCKSGLDIFLNPLDVWNIRNELEEPTTSLKEKYFVFETRAEYGSYPFCLLKMMDDYCPFLEDSLCSIHYARPSSCRFFPVVHFFEEGRFSAFALSPDMPECPGRGDKKEYTLMGWLVVNSYISFIKIIDFIPEFAEPLSGLFDDDVVAPLYDILYNFDTIDDFPYLDQFPQDNTCDELVADWIIKRARKFIESLKSK